MDHKNIEISSLIKNYKKYQDQINSALKEELEFYSSSEFYEPLQYALQGGKRIRPIILLLAAESVGSYEKNAFSAACAIELLHTESVIHDDIIDNETLRRKKEPFHIRYGYNASILSGDFVLGLILNISSKINNPRTAKELATAAMMMSDGEMLEERLESSEDVTMDDYLKVMEYKTAIAFEAAAKLGAILGGGTEEQILCLSEYGRNMGMAYQIRDDLEDWNNEDKLFNILIKKSRDPRDVFNRMEFLLKEYSDKARHGLRKIDQCPAKTHLENILKLILPATSSSSSSQSSSSSSSSSQSSSPSRSS